MLFYDGLVFLVCTNILLYFNNVVLKNKFFFSLSLIQMLLQPVGVNVSVNLCDEPVMCLRLVTCSASACWCRLQHLDPPQ